MQESISWRRLHWRASLYLGSSLIDSFAPCAAFCLLCLVASRQDPSVTVSGRLRGGTDTYSHHAVFWLKLLGSLVGIIKESKAGRLSTTELSAETKDDNRVLVSLVHGGELVSKLIL